MIPKIDEQFVPFGEYDNCKKILDSGDFYPCMLTGPSGIGKTVLIRQICAELERDFYRVNIVYQTDEDDLIGGIRLQSGDTTFQKGPVIEAMEAGGVLLLDEVDLASPMLIMCLQSILEGDGYLIKKTGEWVTPKPGFQIFATANTKGNGDTTGAFVGTQVLNEAFLERFPITFECDYPPKDIEKKILTNAFKSARLKTNKELLDALVTWASDIRDQYKKGQIDNTMSTRRLIHIIKALKIWDDAKIAVANCLNRFETHTKKAFLDMFELEWAETKAKKSTKNGTPMHNWEPW